MGDLAKALNRFLMRDVTYVLAGLYVITASTRILDPPFFQFENLGGLDSHSAELIILIGSAYVIGFVVKEVFALFHIVVEAHYFKPSWLERNFYSSHQSTAWTQPPMFKHNLVYAEIAKAGLAVQNRYDRISDLIHLCSNVGCALIVSGMILVISDGFNGVAALVLGAALIAMSRFHAMRRMLFMSDYRKE